MHMNYSQIMPPSPFASKSGGGVMTHSSYGSAAPAYSL